MRPRYLAQAGVIAAIYALLTLCLAPLSYGLIQCRVSEALCVLPFYSNAAIPGLFIGCLLANILTGAPLPDVVFGSLATLAAAFATHWLSRVRFGRGLAPLPSVLINAAVVGALLVRVYGVGVPYLAAAGYVALGQALACYGLGMPLMLLLERGGGDLIA